MVRSSFRPIIALVAVVIALFAFGSQAGPQSYPGAPFTGSATGIVPGGQITFSGSGFIPNAPGTLTVESTPVVYDLTFDETGSFSITVPAPTEPGPHKATVTDGVNTLVFNFVVDPAAGTAGSAGGATPVQAGSLPYTGNDSAPFVQIGIALLAVGALITIIVRTRRTHNA